MTTRPFGNVTSTRRSVAVATVPKALRLRLARDPGWTTWVGNLAVRAIGAWQRRITRQRGLRAPRTGAITFVQRFGAWAEPLLERALRIREHVFGAEHPNVAVSLNNLAELQHTLGKYAEAEQRYTRALQIVEHAHGAEHPDVAIALNNLAGAYQDQGAYDLAVPLFERALRICEDVLGPEQPESGAHEQLLGGAKQTT